MRQISFDELVNYLKWLRKQTLFLLALSCPIGCSDQKGSFLKVLDQGSGSQYLVIASTDTNTRSVVAYDPDGNFIQLLKNFLLDVGLPRGISFSSPNQLLISLDTTDRIHSLEWDGEELIGDSLFSSAGLSGNIYDIESDAAGNSYVVHSNQIRRYDSTGGQVGNPYINTTVGLCVLNNPRGAFLTSDNRLIVTNQGGTDQILIYDVSSPTAATCLSAVNVGNNPYGVLLHSNGDLYFVTQGNDQIYRADADGGNATAIFTTNTTILNDPTAIVEHPNGNILVASSVTDAIWEFDPDGVVIGTQPFIQDPLTLNIVDMEFINLETE